MEQNLTVEALKLIKRQKRRRLWTKLLSFMACVVVFCTTYALILPAITKETNVFCGQEGHIHEDFCYEETLICGYAEISAEPQHSEHVHSSECYLTEKQLICQLPECQEHVHSDDCKTYDSVLSCGMKESTGHTHGQECMIAEKTLICTLPEDETHAHGDGCYSETVSMVCGLQETAGHSHSDACYTQTENIVCGLAEPEGHVHSDVCYGMIELLVCEVSSDTESSAGEQFHEHTDACYEKTLICKKEEHEHTLSCYSDSTADVELKSQWESTLPKELTGDYAQDVLAVAKSQLGYTESSRNYQVMEDGVTTKGYTRYGAWYGVPYGDWCAMFVSFCLSYAEVEDYPLDCYCPTWVSNLRKIDAFYTANDMYPVPGDIIFFDWDNDGYSDHVGLVAEFIPATEHGSAQVRTIEGNSADRVQYVKYKLNDPDIMGYGALPTDETELLPDEETEEPEVTLDPNKVNAWVELTEEPGEEEKSVETPELPLRDAPSVMETEQNATIRLLSNRNDVRFAAPRSSGLDMASWINTVTMYKHEGNEVIEIPSGSTVSEGDLIQFKLEYTIPGQQLAVMDNEQVSVISNTVTYQIPDTFQTINNDSGNIYDDSGQIVGTFRIDSITNLISLVYSDDFVEENAQGKQIHGYISFYSVIAKVSDAESEEQEYQFNDTVKVDLNIQEKVEAEGDLSVEKAKLHVDGNKISYMITVTSLKGTSAAVALEDIMSEGLDYVPDSLTVTSKHQNIDFDVLVSAGSLYLTLPQMAPGDTYIIQYESTVDGLKLDKAATVENTVTVSSKDSQDNDLTDTTTVTHTYDLLEKKGVSGDAGEINWTVVINRDKLDISGWVLHDVLEGVAYNGPVTIEDSAGNVIHRNTSLPYTFPEGSTDTYTITYTTTHELGKGQNITNEVDLNNKIVVEDTARVGPPASKNGQVLGNIFIDADGNPATTVQWTVTIDATNVEIPDGYYFYDKLDGNSSTADDESDQYMTYSQLLAAIEAIKEAVGAAGGSVEKWEAAEFVPGVDDYGSWISEEEITESKKYERFIVYLDKGIPKGNRVTFTYETTGSFPNHTVSNVTYKNRINLNDRFEQTAETFFSAGIIDAQKIAMAFKSKYSSSEPDWNEEYGDITYINYEDMKDNYLAWQIDVKIPADYKGTGDIVIHEELPEGVSVDQLQIRSTSYMPLWMEEVIDVTPGASYELVYWIFPDVSEYDKSDRENGERAIIKIDVTEDGDLDITVPESILKLHADFADYYELDEMKFYIFIYTLIDENFPWSSTTENSLVYKNAFENSFSVENSDGDIIDFGSQTQTVTKDDTDGNVIKSAVTDEDFITYQVVLNPKGLDFDPDSNSLKIKDTLTYDSTEDKYLKASLIAGSVKLYNYNGIDDNNAYILGSPVDFSYVYNEESVTDENGVATRTHTLDLVVPDGKPLLLEYRYFADGDRDTHVLLNTCSIEGIGQAIIDGDAKIELEVKETTAGADIAGVLLYKVDANNNGIFLEGAKFNLYIWNKEKEEYILVSHPDGGSDFVTDKDGKIILDRTTMADEYIAYNTAYYLVETSAPNDYYILPEPYYFYVRNENVIEFPECKPDDFDGVELIDGEIIYISNESRFTEITVRKKWQDHNYNDIPVTGDQIGSITIELWQKLQGDYGSDKLFGTYTVTPDETGFWEYTIRDLPKGVPDESDGTKGTPYLYYIKEITVPGYEVTYDYDDGDDETKNDSRGINSGVITITNREEKGYDLPETGGAGKLPYTLGGLLLMATAAMAFLMYKFKPRRREEPDSS